MFVKLGGKFLKVAGKFATSLACCCGFDPEKKWKCLLSSDGSYRCAQEYDFEQDQMLSEHSSKEDCERFCGQDQVYCYYDDKIGYYCTNYFSEGYLSGPYPDTITCNEACKQMWFCIDKGSGGGETQYECTLQDPSEDYLSGPYGSKEACEYRCGNQWWCTYKYINTDEYEYECVQDNTGEPDNAVSGPYMSKVECDTYCEICEEIILPEQTPCPDCVDDACVYLAGEGGIDGGQWGTCCAGLIETWRYCDGEWTRILPCHPRETRTAGTPACEVYPEKLDFPDNPSEGQLYDVECDRVLDFDPSDYPDCEDCDYNCVDNNGAYECELDPAGPHKTLQDCIDKCPEKWGCISTDECVQKPDGTYLTEAECVDNAPVDCAATGACCFPDYTCRDDDGFNTEGECVDAGGSFVVNGVCPDACPEPPTGCCCRLKEDGSYDKVITTTSDECSAYISPLTDVIAVQFNARKTCDDPTVECPDDPRDLGCCYVYLNDPAMTLQPQGLTTKQDCQAAQDEVTVDIDCIWHPNSDGQTCENDCYEYEEYYSTYAEAEESFGANYGQYGWSLAGGQIIFDSSTDQWRYKAVCCDELSYDDQGNEWCGTANPQWGACVVPTSNPDLFGCSDVQSQSNCTNGSFFQGKTCEDLGYATNRFNPPP